MLDRLSLARGANELLGPVSGIVDSGFLVHKCFFLAMTFSCLLRQAIIPWPTSMARRRRRDDALLFAESINWATIPASIDEPFIEIADPLPDDWRQLPALPSTRKLGSYRVAESRSVALRVPSIVVDGEFNYVLNPRHPDFARCTSLCSGRRSVS